LAATEDGDGDFVNFGGGEDELHMGRWFLERLEEGVPCVVREHVHFVDDEDFEAVSLGSVREAFLKPAHVIDAGVAGTVDLLNVDVAADGDLSASRALLARRCGGAFFAIERLGEDAGAGRFAYATNAGEQKGVCNAVSSNRVGQRGRYVTLTNEILERLWPVFTREDDVAHAGVRLADRRAGVAFERGGGGTCRSVSRQRGSGLAVGPTSRHTRDFMQFRGGMNELVRQAARMQRKIDQVKAGIKDNEVSATAGSDKVTVTVTCEGKIRKIAIDPEFLASEGLEMSLDLVVAAANSALDQADKQVEAEIAKVTGGLKIPGVQP
jgi:DNA-binding YbaB/EbfC family protein